jgi:hypothetical protein
MFENGVKSFWLYRSTCPQIFDVFLEKRLKTKPSTPGVGDK